MIILFWIFEEEGRRRGGGFALQNKSNTTRTPYKYGEGLMMFESKIIPTFIASLYADGYCLLLTDMNSVWEGNQMKSKTTLGPWEICIVNLSYDIFL